MRARLLFLMVLVALVSIPMSAVAVFVDRELLDFSTRLEERVRTAVENYLADGKSKIVVFANIKDTTQDRKVASSGNEVDLGYIPIPLDLSRIPKLHAQKDVEIYGVEVEVIVSTPRKDIDAKKVGRLVRRLLRGMNPEVDVRVNTIELRTEEYMELERKLASLETRNLMLQNHPDEGTGGAAIGFLSILVGAGVICIAIFFLIRSINDAARGFGSGGPPGSTGLGMGQSGTDAAAQGGFRAAAISSDPVREAINGLEQNLVVLKEMIKIRPRAFASVMGQDGRDWSSIQAFLPLFDSSDRDALKKVVSEHGLPLILSRFEETIENDRIHFKAAWLNEFVERLLSAPPLPEPQEVMQVALAENEVIGELDGFLASMVDGYQPIQSSDYPLMVGPTSDDRAPLELRPAEVMEFPIEQESSDSLQEVVHSA